jgi:CubicO group peptidase (beta-lactamase class C family)
MDDVQGDAGLAAQVRSLLGARHPVVAAAVVSGAAVADGEARVAGVGAALDADFELGSISKGTTGLLHADACGRGELGPDTTLGELLPLGDCPAAGVSLVSASRHSSGRPRQPWTGEALAPAGGIRASIGDMARLVQALLDGSAPGTSALDPVADFAGPAARIGAARITLRVKGRDITWHNGATGGFRTWVGLDREAGTGVAILSATAVPVDRHGFRLLRQLTE